MGVLKAKASNKRELCRSGYFLEGSKRHACCWWKSNLLCGLRWSHTAFQALNVVQVVAQSTADAVKSRSLWKIRVRIPTFKAKNILFIFAANFSNSIMEDRRG